ncbi:MAG: GNAT family N-acetyltransferase [Burkholderiales bacterium]
MTRADTGVWQLGRFDPTDAAAARDWNALQALAGGSVVQRAELVFAAAAMSAVPLTLAVLRRQDEPRAMALVRARPGLPEVFVESQMPLGAWLQAPGEDLAALARSLLARLPLGLRLGVSQLDPRFVPVPDDPQVSTLPYIRTPWLAVSGGFADYWAARGKNLRANLRKQRDRLAAQGVALRTEVLTEPADMARAVADYAALESRGWKAGEGTAVSPSHPQFGFYRGMLEAFARQGVARVYRCFFGEQLVASELCLLDRGEFVILKTTYDESTAPLSPASLLRQPMFEGLFEEGRVDRVEFYGPLKEWHTRWSSQTRDIYHANVHAGRLAQAVVSALRRRPA